MRAPSPTLPPIIDVEASGLRFDSYPVEIAVLAHGTVKSWLIKPEPDWQYWDPVAEDMHGISREMLRQQGVTALQVARELNATVHALGGVVYSDAAEWDSDWIQTLYLTTGIAWEFLVSSIQQLLNDAQRQQFNTHREQLESSGGYRVHRAGEDVRLILEAYRQALTGARDRSR